MDGLDRPDSGPGRSTFRQRVPGKHSTKGLVDRRRGMAASEKRNIFCPCLKSNHDSSTVQPASLNLLPKPAIKPRLLACTARSLFIKPTMSPRILLNRIRTCVTNVRISYVRSTTIANMAPMRNFRGSFCKLTMQYLYNCNLLKTEMRCIGTSV